MLRCTARSRSGRRRAPRRAAHPGRAAAPRRACPRRCARRESRAAAAARGPNPNPNLRPERGGEHAQQQLVARGAVDDHEHLVGVITR
eukprot:scaffold29916_cov23-Phaeocystis_antarctica.AAC.1